MYTGFCGEDTSIGQANFSGDIGRDRYFKHDLILLIMPLAFNGSQGRIPSCLCVSYSFWGQSVRAAFSSIDCSSAFCLQTLFANSINSSVNKQTLPFDKPIFAKSVCRIRQNLQNLMAFRVVFYCFRHPRCCPSAWQALAYRRSGKHSRISPVP